LSNDEPQTEALRVTPVEDATGVQDSVAVANAASTSAITRVKSPLARSPKSKVTNMKLAAVRLRTVRT
jgi:hypothetical protein